MDNYVTVTIKSLEEIGETFTDVEVVGDKMFGVYDNKHIDVSSLLVDVCETVVKVKDVHKRTHGFYYSYLHPITNADGGTSLIFVYLMKEWVDEVVDDEV